MTPIFVIFRTLMRVPLIVEWGYCGAGGGGGGTWPGSQQRHYIIETMHSYTVPMLCLSGLHLSLLQVALQSVAIANTLG